MINWFPGHMAKALRQIRDKQMLADVFVVVLDARAPLSSYNMEFDNISPEKSRLFIISKKDLGDENKINQIMKKFHNHKDEVLALNLKNNSSKKIIMKKLNIFLDKKKEINLKKGIQNSRLRVFVVGVPNSGKSTLINILSSSSKAKTANMPGVTRGQQWVKTQTLDLLDTPGILWPKFESELIGIKLAIIGSIKKTILPIEELSLEAYKLISKYYPDKLLNLNLKPSNDDVEIYNQMFAYSKIMNISNNNNDIVLSLTRNHFVNFVLKLKGITYD